MNWVRDDTMKMNFIIVRSTCLLVCLFKNSHFLTAISLIIGCLVSDFHALLGLCFSF